MIRIIYDQLCLILWNVFNLQVYKHKAFLQYVILFIM